MAWKSGVVVLGVPIDIVHVGDVDGASVGVS